MHIKWESIGSNTYRLRVPHGWLVRYQTTNDGKYDPSTGSTLYSYNNTMQFIEDELGLWDNMALLDKAVKG